MRAKKRLGQHFLSAPVYLRAIAEAGGAASGEIVLEVGPGKGTLTEELLRRGARVIAIEKDADLLPLLAEKFKTELASGQLSLILGDILVQDLSSLGLQAGKYAVIANIPYYITGAIIRFFLSNKLQPSRMALLVQKEVAERIARDTKESVLSLSVKCYGTPRFVRMVPRGAFTPAPKVDSAILSITDIGRRHFSSPAEEERFFVLLHAGFSSPRKMLASNLAKMWGKQVVREALIRANIPEKSRAEDVALPAWLALSRLLPPQNPTALG